MNRELYFRQRFGDEWFELLKDFLMSYTMDAIGKAIAKDRETYTIIPENQSSLLFKVFRDLAPKDVKVIILGQDPYPQEGIYDGYAFSNSNSLDNKISPSLRNIMREIKKEYPDNLQLDRMDWSYLVKQGVFPINTALSIRVGQSESHLDLWKRFTKDWITELNTYNDIIWVLWGKKAQKYKGLIKNPSHAIIETSHPSPLGAHYYAPIPFTDSKCFTKVNTELELRNLKPILW